jgi:uridine kinase
MPSATVKTTNRSKKRAKKSPKHTTVLHGMSNDNRLHVVEIGNLRVVVVPDGKHWFAQGLEIDYAEQGDSLESAKENFEKGLALTIQEHIMIKGNIEGLLKQAPPEYWKPILRDPAADKNYFSLISGHQLISEQTSFKGIEYIIAAKHAAQAAGNE